MNSNVFASSEFFAEISKFFATDASSLSITGALPLNSEAMLSIETSVSLKKNTLFVKEYEIVSNVSSKTLKSTLRFFVFQNVYDLIHEDEQNHRLHELIALERLNNPSSFMNLFVKI